MSDVWTPQQIFIPSNLMLQYSLLNLVFAHWFFLFYVFLLLVLPDAAMFFRVILLVFPVFSSLHMFIPFSPFSICIFIVRLFLSVFSDLLFWVTSCFRGFAPCFHFCFNVFLISTSTSCVLCVCHPVDDLLCTDWFHLWWLVSLCSPVAADATLCFCAFIAV